MKYTEKRIKDTRDMFIVPSIHTRHALVDARTHSDRVSTSPTFHETFSHTNITQRHTCTHTQHTHTHTHTHIVSHKRIHIRKYTKMGNITRYLGVARVYMSLQWRCRNLIFASSNRIVDSGILRRCEIHFYDRCGDPESIHTSPLRPATVVDLTVESDAV